MERVKGGEPLPPHLRGAVVALGNFDGFHLGHQAVVGRAVETARRRGAPGDRRDLRPASGAAFQTRRGTVPAYDTGSAREAVRASRCRSDDGLRVRRAACCGDSGRLRARLAGRRVGRGHRQDFTFGKGRGGNVQLLAELGARTGHDCGCRCRGARWRESRYPRRASAQALQAGDCTTATRLLTRPFAIEGACSMATRWGGRSAIRPRTSTLGSYLRPRYGVYAVRVRLADGRVRRGAANLGIRPQFEPPKELLEALSVRLRRGFVRTVRSKCRCPPFCGDEAKFDSLDALVAQMDRDCDEARRILSAPAT